MAKVLLVVGNGFDIKCGLKSSFKQFLDSNYYSTHLNQIKMLCDKVVEDLKYPSVYDGYAVYSSYPIDFTGLSFWDLYFGIPHVFQFNDIDLWYSFEDRISNFIDSIYKKGEFATIVELHTKKITSQSHDDKKFVRYLILYFYLKSLSDSFDEKSINIKLYDELKTYERLFGGYIHAQQIGDKSYLSNANNVIDEMLEKHNGDEVVYINTFNYSDLSSIVKDVWHINGDYERPIFGVDYPSVGPDDVERYRYTKTYRRLELTGNDKYFPKQKNFTKVIVFGHSLNKQDYSYFFSLFNNLKLESDRIGNRRGYYVEFVYSKHGNKSSAQVREETVSGVLKMFYEYNKEILHENNFRLIDILFSTGALRFKEIK